MPCTYDGQIENPPELARLNEVTGMLCELIQTIETHNKNVVFSKIQLTPKTQTFWRQHKKLDKKRQESEKIKKELIRRRAISKLTEEEREALNIK